MYGNFSSNVVTATGELPNPYRLEYGQTLYIRPIGSTKPSTHTFNFWETVSRIALQHRIANQELLAANPEVDFYSLTQGQTLHLPLDAGRLEQPSSHSGMKVLANSPFCPGKTMQAQPLQPLILDELPDRQSPH